MNEPMRGLTSREAEERLRKYGRNVLTPGKKRGFFSKLIEILSEPMFLLLVLAAAVYFILGERRDGIIMLFLVMAMVSVDVIQGLRTDRTLRALGDLTAPRATVIRDGRELSVSAEELVPGDVMLISEGERVPADGQIIECHDLLCDESPLTGESAGVWKRSVADAADGRWRRDACYAGTLIQRGSGIAEVTATGTATEYGRIGAFVAAAPDRPTPLEKQTRKLVRYCAWLAAALFVLVGVITFVCLPRATEGRFIQAVLAGVTLAMAMIPEEFPVILTVFLSMGAWRLARKNALVSRLSAVETLGAVSVLCVDKTGTITVNRMSVRDIWAADGDTAALAEVMGMGCETDAYDPMEKAMLEYCESAGIPAEHLFGGELITEYPFTDELKMMGHVWRHEGEVLVAAKGSPERLLTLCAMTADGLAAAKAEIARMAADGLRVIAVGIQKPDENAIPAVITDCDLTLLGLVGLADPPREGVAADIAACRTAGVRVVMITGDSGATAEAIARQIGMETGRVVTGDMLDAMDDDALDLAVGDVSVFSRVVPEHKMRIVNALKRRGEVVAMTGDGVNDAPALKHADIGIAMGKRGSQVSREAADLVLMDDDFSTIVNTIRDGRRIYDNIVKAVSYVFSIHIPIALSSLLSPILGLGHGSLFLLPLHVVLLELMIDPTCSVVLERCPAEADIMTRPPRDPAAPLMTARRLVNSLLKGLSVFAASFGAYAIMLHRADATTARAMGLSVLILANLFLVLTAGREPLRRSLRRQLRDKVTLGVLIAAPAILALILYTPLNGLLKLAPLSAPQLLICLVLAVVACCLSVGKRD